MLYSICYSYNINHVNMFEDVFSRENEHLPFEYRRTSALDTMTTFYYYDYSLGKSTFCLFAEPQYVAT